MTHSHLPTTGASVQVLPGARIPLHWLDPRLVASRLLPDAAARPASAHTNGLQHWRWQPLVLPTGPARDGPHDRWLLQGAALPPDRRGGSPPTEPIQLPAGSAYALRRLALAGGWPRNWPDPAEPAPLWLIEPVHFHAARDHIVLVHDGERVPSARHLDERLAAIAPLWSGQPDEPWQLLAHPDGLPLWCLRGRSDGLEGCATDLAAGRNIDLYLPTGPNARDWRRFHNEIQMTWYMADAQQGSSPDAVAEALPVNGLWVAGRVRADWVRGLQTHLDAGGILVDTRLQACLLRDDPHGWLQQWERLLDDWGVVAGQAGATGTDARRAGTAGPGAGGIDSGNRSHPLPRQIVLAGETAIGQWRPAPGGVPRWRGVQTLWQGLRTWRVRLRCPESGPIDPHLPSRTAVARIESLFYETGPGDTR